MVAGVAVTGTTIYTTTRNQSKAVDMIELLEAVEERQRAVDWNVAPGPTVSTQKIRSWVSNTNGWTYPVPAGTGAPSSNNFLTYAGLVDLVTTNDNTGLDYSSTYRSTTGRYVWAGWSNLTASGFPILAGIDPNLAYDLAGYNDGVGYYTNLGGSTGDVAVLLDVRTRDHANDQTGRGWVLNLFRPSTNLYPWDWTELGEDSLDSTFYSTTNTVDSFRAQWQHVTPAHNYAPTGAVAAVGPITVAEIRDEPATTTESHVNALTRHLPATNLMYGLDVVLANLIPSFVDRVDPTNGVVYHTVTGLFATLNIGNGTNLFTRTVTNGVPVYGGVGRQIKRTNMVERYTILQALTQTVVSIVWENSIVTNAASNVNYAAMEGDGWEGDPPVRTNGTDYWPEPWGDAILTNVSDDCVPAYWEEVDIDAGFGQAFYDDIPQTFDGSIRGPVDVLTNTASPAWEYEFQFNFYERADVGTRTFTGPSGYYIQDISRIFEFAPTTPMSTNYSSNHIVYARVAPLVIQGDLTGVTYNLTHWVIWEDRTNYISPAFFTTGTWGVIYSTNVADFTQIPYTNPALEYDMANPMDSITIGIGTELLTKVAPFIPSGGGTAAQWLAVHQSDQAETNAMRYYGRRSKSNAAVITWDFQRAQ